MGELTAVPGLGNVMKHNSYYTTMAQTVVQVKMASLQCNKSLKIHTLETISFFNHLAQYG